jgi:hypothetical protein
VQIFRERLALRAGQVFLAVVEAAAVDRPQFTKNAAPRILLLLWRRQRIVEHHEIEGRADPRDAGDEMQPADKQVEPVDYVRFHPMPWLWPAATRARVAA